MAKSTDNVAKKALEAAAGYTQEAIRTVVNFGFSGQRQLSEHAGKSDGVFKRYSLDTLRRAAYNNVFGTLFQASDDDPYVTPDKTLKNHVFSKLKSNIFATGMTVSADDEKITQLSQTMIEEVGFRLKAEEIIEEAALMGYCAIRTVFVKASQQWLFEVKPKEYLVLEEDPNSPGQYLAIGLEWDVIIDGRKYWKKERWTPFDYETWPPLAEKYDGQKPIFLDGDKTVEPNIYGEIPFTIVPHYFDSTYTGIGVVNDEEILTVKALIRLRHFRHWTHNTFMKPELVAINRTNPGDPLQRGIGRVIDIQQMDPQMPADAKLLEYQGIPDSVRDEIYDHVKDLFEAAGLKPPPKEDQIKVGQGQAGVALRMLDKDDAKTIETLRDNGYSNVFRHMEKILRMGKTIGLPGYEIVPDDPAAYRLTAKYPDFFPPTDQDVTVKLANIKAAGLPIDRQARIVASLFGIEDENEIQEIKANLQTEKDIQQANAAGPQGGF